MKWLSDFTASAKNKMAKFNNKKFKDSVMSTCALIAAADGKIDPTEKAKVLSLIQNNDLLKVFPAAELGAAFLDACEKAENEFARLDLLTLVKKIKADDGAVGICLKVALIVANADGNFDEKEVAVFKEICKALGEDPSEYI